MPKKVIKKKAESVCLGGCCYNMQSIAFFMVLIGFWWLARDYGWIDWRLPFWPMVLIFIGIYHLADCPGSKK